jgi:hypothetical protein
VLFIYAKVSLTINHYSLKSRFMNVSILYLIPVIKPIPKVQAYIRVNYRILTAACNAAQTNIRVRTFEEFRKMKDLFTGQFCQQADCTDITVLTTCQTINSGKRRKRQTSSLSNFLLEITLPLIDSR